MKLKLLNNLGIYVLYIVDINNYIYIEDKSILNHLNIDKDVTPGEFIDFIHKFFPEMTDKFSRILRSFERLHMTKANNQRESNKRYTLCIHPSRVCNLQCRYCFGHDEYLPSEISLEMAKKAIDFFVFKYGTTGNMYTIDLSGSGEPLLRFDFIREIDNYCETLRNRTGKRIIITFVTNATLITDEIIYFLKNSRYILYGVSIDGNNAQNSLRVYKNKTPIYNDIIYNINKINNGHLGLAVTITHNNEDVDIVYSHLIPLEVDAISMHLVRNFGETETSLYKIDIQKLILHYNKLIDLLIQNIKKGKYKFVLPLIRGDDMLGTYIKKALNKGVIPKYRCDAGKNRLAVDAEGNLYSCSVLNGNTDFKIGNIFSGINTDAQDKFKKPNIEVNKKCEECWCKNICAGECMVNSYINNKSLYEPNEYLCIIRKHLISLAISFVEYIRINYEKAYIKIKEFTISTASFFRSESGIWAIKKYLGDKKIDVNYDEIDFDVSKINAQYSCPVSRGIHPESVLKYLLKYNKNVRAVEVTENITDEQTKSFPAIAFINKVNSLLYHYCFIEKIENNLIYFMMLESEKVQVANLNNFFEYFSDIFIGDF